MALTGRDFDRVIGKLKMTQRDGKHRLAFLEHNGQVVLWTERSHGRGDLGAVEFAIRKQLKVNDQQMRDLVNCPMTREAYIEHLRAKGILS